MPELPEVETVRRVLRKWVNGKVIKDVLFLYHSLIDGISEEEFKSKVIGQRINEVDREGKFLLFKLDDFILSSHLRMEGKYYYGKCNNSLIDFEYEGSEDIDKVRKHACALFLLDDNSVLIYHDVRKFGRMHLYSNDEFIPYVSLSLGKEPFYVSSSEFYNKIKNKNNTIKELLLDQSIMSGIGNIYADEICFVSSIHPTRKGKDVSIEECKKIVEASIKILNQAIEDGGSTIKSYHSGNGVDGLFQQRLLVYGRKGKDCVICGNKINKIRLKGRGTCFCEFCQR